jgi:hypothetical protein
MTTSACRTDEASLDLVSEYPINPAGSLCLIFQYMTKNILLTTTVTKDLMIPIKLLFAIYQNCSVGAISV